MPFNDRDPVYMVRDRETGEIHAVLPDDAYDVFEDTREIISQHHEEGLRLIPPGPKRVTFTTIKEDVTIKTVCWLEDGRRHARTSHYRGGPGEQRGGRYVKQPKKSYPFRS